MSAQTYLKSEQPHISANDLKGLFEGDQPVTVIDVRTTGEFRSGHIARAINVPMDDIESRLEDIPQSDKIVLVCQSGKRAQMTQDLLGGQLGNVTCLDGGIDSWASADLPVVRATRTKLALDRQALIVASMIILMSVALGAFVHPYWFYLALLPGVGLMLAGTMGFCLMGVILSTMPWNKSRSY